MSPDSLPTGTVTFLLTDVEGSTQLWEQEPELTMAALARHDAIIESQVASHKGTVVKPRGEGDSRFIVFKAAGDAVSAAAGIQRLFFAEFWDTPRPLKVRMALHSGQAGLHAGDYYGQVVNRCARLRVIAHGGQILLSQVTWELIQDALPPDVSIHDHGEHRLKDLSRPEHVFELRIGGLSPDFPPLQSLSGIPNNLPLQLTEFVGRESELQKTRRLLEENRLLTLVGPGGIGKSRLAIALAAETSDQYRHGVYFVGLAPLPSADSVIQAAAEGIGLALAADTDAKEQLLSYLRNRQLLLLLDNFEHVMEAAGLIREVLLAAPAVRTIVTSRERLRLTGEVVFEVQGLDFWRTTAPTSQDAAARLFVATAGRARPGFHLQDDDVDPLRRIVSMVGGSPLGILLAASWVDMLPVARIAEEVSSSLDFLETQARDIPDRQRSVRAVFDYSWRMLSSEEQKLFEALSIFRGGFTRQAAEQVAGASLRQLANLANKSFLTAEPEEERYTVHELLRQYGEESLNKEPAHQRAAAEAHARYYAALAEQAFSKMTGGRQLEGLTEIESDVENVRAAWRYLTATGDPAEAIRMIRGIWFLYEIRGWYVAADDLFGEALQAAKKRQETDSLKHLVADAKSILGAFAALRGDLRRSFLLGEQATSALRELGATSDLVFALAGLGIAYYLTGQREQVRTICQEMLSIVDDPWLNAEALMLLGQVAFEEGDLEESEGAFQKAEELLGTTNEVWLGSWPIFARAQRAAMEGNYRQARKLLEEHLAFVRVVDWKRGVLFATGELGKTALAMEDYEPARRYFLHSLRVSEELGMTAAMAGAVGDLAEVLAAEGRAEAALEMAAVAFSHPLAGQMRAASPVLIRDHVLGVRESASEALAPEVAEKAWERGLAAEFEAVVARLMDEAV